MKRPRKRASSVAVIDIGSNSVRLVVYETMARSLVTCSTRRRCAGSAARCRAPACWPTDAVAKALTALRRFRALCRIQQVGRLRDRHRRLPRRQNGPDFIAKAERICGAEIQILSGPREAKLSALGVVSGIHNPDGIVGDLGGGSLELIDVQGNRVRSGVTLPLGSLALQDLSHKSLKRAERIVRNDRPTSPSSRPAVAAPSTRSAAPGARWRASTSSRGLSAGVMHGY